MMKHELIDIRMDDVLNLLRLNIVKQHGNELNAYCPKCDIHKIKGEGHLYINVYKNTFFFDTPNPLKGMGFLAALFRLLSMEHLILHGHRGVV